jgi:hypothetical protein
MVGAPETLQFVPVDFARTGPALGGTQHDHRPIGPEGADLPHRPLHGFSHGSVHRHRLAALNEDRLPAVTEHQALQLLMGDAG